jgi:hypothetical protein
MIIIKGEEKGGEGGRARRGGEEKGVGEKGGEERKRQHLGTESQLSIVGTSSSNYSGG